MALQTSEKSPPCVNGAGSRAAAGYSTSCTALIDLSGMVEKLVDLPSIDKRFYEHTATARISRKYVLGCMWPGLQASSAGGNWVAGQSAVSRSRPAG